MHSDQPSWKTTTPDARAALAPYRGQIDAIDDRIIALIGERFDIVREVARLKARHGIHPVLNDRIEEVVARARSGARAAGFDPDLAEGIYRLMIDAACRLEAGLSDQGESLAQ